MLKEYFMNRKTTHELYKLNDHELNDIGLTRGDIFDLSEEGISFVSALFAEIKKMFNVKTKTQFVDEYLSQSVDRVDLERRERELVKMGYLQW
jgi:CTP-dependent riboflavin kinase